jgi:hypothetical protein
VHTRDHHTQYLAKTVAALSPDGRARVNELLAELAKAGHDRAALLEFAHSRQQEAETSTLAAATTTEPILTGAEIDALLRGFITIRDEEYRDDVSDWANAVIALLVDLQRS